jgi:hypothetical protein
MRGSPPRNCTLSCQFAPPVKLNVTCGNRRRWRGPWAPKHASHRSCTTRSCPGRAPTSSPLNAYRHERLDGRGADTQVSCRYQSRYRPATGVASQKCRGPTGAEVSPTFRDFTQPLLKSPAAHPPPKPTARRRVAGRATR